MGCTTIYTPDDFRQSMQSLGRDFRQTDKPLTGECRKEIQEFMHKSAGSKILLKILDDPDHPDFQSVQNLLVKIMETEKNKMTEAEKALFPHACRIVLREHPTAMGLFMAATKERAPEQSAVQHHYEILSAAAMMKSEVTTRSGKKFTINPADRTDFGIKMAAGYGQTKRHGTIEADIMVHKPGMFGLTEKTVGIDSKYSQDRKYGKLPELERQLKGIQIGFRDGKIDEFIFVTNGIFKKEFIEKVDEYNVKIVEDVIRGKNKELLKTPNEYLTNAEKANLPESVIKKEIVKDDEQRKELVAKYNIPQIDICEHVNFK